MQRLSTIPSGLDSDAPKDRPVAGTSEPDRDGAVRRIVAPGRNCWRTADARRIGVLANGASYFSCLEGCLRQARRSIMIVGWDFDGRIRLRQDAPEDESPPVGTLLRELVEANPGLEVRILVWSIALLHAPSEPFAMLFGAEWQRHPRIHLKLDRTQPIYGAHHQKIVVVDDALAFVGGIDLTVRRWDNRKHHPDDPARVSPEGTPYGPVHDVQMVVDHEAARAVADVARDRWRRGTGEDLRPFAPSDLGWPSACPADIVDHPVALARTAPAIGGEDGVDEVLRLTLDSLSAARRTIFLEAQYLTSLRVAGVLARALAREGGPEVVVIMTRDSRGAVERFAMGNNRDRLLRRLREHDRHGRLRALYPLAGGDQVLVHSKLIMIDDDFVRVGSSNLNNRSMGLDTELDLAVEAETRSAREAIARMRNRLIGEHVGMKASEVAEQEARAGSLVRALDRLAHETGRLGSFKAMTDVGPVRPVIGTCILDPERPLGARRRPLPLPAEEPQAGPAQLR